MLSMLVRRIWWIISSVSLVAFTDQYVCFNYYKKWLCIKEKLGLDHFKALEQFGILFIQNCLLLNTNNHTQFIQLSFSFIYSCLANKTDRIWKKFIMGTEAAVEGKRMYFWILLKLLDQAVCTRSILEKKATKLYPNYCLNGQRQIKTINNAILPISLVPFLL